MHLFSFIQFLLLLFGAVGFLLVLRTLIVRHTLKGFRLITAGFALVYLNIILDSLYHSNILPEPWNDVISTRIGFITGYFGLTIGMFLLLIGNYRLVRSLVPQLSERYSSLVEKALVGVYLIQDGELKFVNERIAEIFGYTRDELFGRPMLDFIAPESRETVSENVRKRLDNNGEPMNYSFVGLKKDGTKIDVEVYGSRTIYNGKPAIHGTLLDITDRKRAEATLLESESKFRTVVESLGEGVLITDVDDKVVYINSRMADLCGYAPEEMIGRRAYTLLLPQEKWDAMKTRNKDRLLGKLERYEVFITRKDGSQLWVEINATPYMDTDGKIVGTLGAVTSIQDRKRAEALQSALYRIAEKTHSTVDLQDFYSSVHSIINELMSAKNFYIALYDASTQILSFPYFVDEVDPQPSPKKLGKGLTEYVLRTGQPLLASPDVFQLLLHEDEVESIGAPSIDWLGVPLKSGEATFGAIVVQSYTESVRYGEKEREILTFVSQQIATAIQRKADEERFRAMWDHSADGMRLTDKDGRIVMVNSAFSKIVKLPQEKLVGEFLSVTYHSDQRSEGLEEYRREFESETVPPRFIGDIALWDGDEIPVEISNSFIVFGANNKMLLSVFRDISERKLLESQLLHAQKMESIGVLAGGIAHDFNNVLSMILTSAEMLKEKTRDDKTLQRYADMVATAAERGAAIAKQLLLFARSEKGKLKPMPVAPVVLEVQKLLEHTLPKFISIRSEIETSDAVILGDSDQLHQALLNLALNSRDAIESKSVNGTIIFRVATVSPEELQRKFPQVQRENYVVVSITDNGTGMSEETVSRIFEPFFSTKGRGKGTGLGLSIVHGISQNHHGLIDVVSTVGQGTTISLFFPLVNAQIKGSANNTSIGHVSGRSREGRPSTILVVDDEAGLREMLKEILEGKEYNVITASNGIEAVKKYQSQCDRIDMVISDLGMPLMGGEEVFGKLVEINPEVKMVFMTGYLEEGSRNGMLRRGVKNIIHKPFRIDEILECVSRVLQE
ncbi:MAG TPA: PAS domain S-box protein [Bacteroidota bacterium]|nr:PAS domain S-box protein [Bacteroidota bacterium]